MTKRTPLYQFHLDHDGKMVEFGGYLLPVNYPTGINTEHKIVREEAGLFDVSHMAEIHLKGPQVLEFLNHLLSNDFSNMEEGQIKYTLMLNHDGGIIDDLLVYYSKDHVMLVCNAGNHEKDYNWIKENLVEGIELIDYSNETSLLALQGPKAIEAINHLIDKALIPEKYYTFKNNIEVCGYETLISRTGYTGEDGIEIYCPNEAVTIIAEELLNTGLVTLCGLGARDTLRLEAGMPLYGHEMDESTTPYQTSLGFFVKMKKENFIGKDALLKDPKDKKRVGLRMIDRGIARQNCDVYVDDKKVGIVTSGTQLPYVGYAGAMAILDKEYSELGKEVIVDVRGRKVKAEIIELPFYSRKKEEK